MTTEKVKNFYRKINELWRKNHYFTFWFIPGNGQNIARKNIEKKRLKYVLSSVAVLGAFFLASFGVMAHIAYQSYVQQQELKEFQQTKQQQEKKLQELAAMAEENQKELAYLGSLEEQLRQQMEKSGAPLPPKDSKAAYGGKGGPMNGPEVSQLNVMLEQEKNLQAEMQAQKKNMENLLRVIQDENYRREFTPNLWPTDSYDITSSFGGRVNPFDNYSADWHPGIDIANYYGAPVYASASGVVERAGWYGGYGRYIKVEHDYGYKTAYGHLSSIAVSAGEYVEKGQLIGRVGSSGYSTGPHLHFEVIKYGEQVNPSDVI